MKYDEYGKLIQGYYGGKDIKINYKPGRTEFFRKVETTGKLIPIDVGFSRDRAAECIRAQLASVR